MTNGELLERIDGTTKEIIANQAYQLGIDDGYKSGIIDSFIDIKKEFEYLLNSGMDKQKCLEHLIKIADKNIKYEQNHNIEAKIDNKPNPPMPKDYGELKIINHPKHIIVNGALYEKIDDSVLTITNGYGDLV